MTATSPFPDTPEDVTAAWLTAAMRTTDPTAEVIAVEVLARHAGTTGRLRLGLTHGPGASGPASVFVKLPPFEDGQRKLVAATDMGRREARFYAELAAEVPLRVPHCHFAAHGEERTEYVMVLEDLEAAGCRFTERAHPGDAEHAGRLIEGLGRLHAHFWEDARFGDASLDWVRPAMRGKRGADFVAMARSSSPPTRRRSSPSCATCTSSGPTTSSSSGTRARRRWSTVTPTRATSSSTAPRSASTTGR